MADPTAVTRGERWEAYHWGLGSLQIARGNARHPEGHLGSHSTRAFHTFAATPPSTCAKEEKERNKSSSPPSPLPRPHHPRPQGQRFSRLPRHRPGEGTRPRSRGAAVAAPGRARARLRGGGNGRAAAGRGVLGPAGTPGRPAGERGGTAAPSVCGRASSRRCRARGSREPTVPAPSVSAEPRLLPDRGGEERTASNKPLHNRRLPQGTWTGQVYVTTLLNTGLIWF